MSFDSFQNLLLIFENPHHVLQLQQDHKLYVTEFRYGLTRNHGWSWLDYGGDVLYNVNWEKTSLSVSHIRIMLGTRCLMEYRRPCINEISQECIPFLLFGMRDSLLHIETDAKQFMDDYQFIVFGCYMISDRDTKTDMQQQCQTNFWNGFQIMGGTVSLAPLNLVNFHAFSPHDDYSWLCTL